MPRRELLTPTERAQLLAFPEDEGELIRLATLSRVDLAFIRQHRGDHNRLGIAVQMSYLRHPSRVLSPREAPHAPLLGIVAAQLRVTPAAWSLYATRDETRREHLQELLARLELCQFDRRHYRALIEWLTPLAMQTTQGVRPGARRGGRATSPPRAPADGRSDRKALCDDPDSSRTGDVPAADGAADGRAPLRPGYAAFRP